MSLSDLGVPVETVRRAAAVPLSSPEHNLFASHLVHLAAAAAKLSDPWQAAALGAASVELARALVATTSPNESAAAQTLHETLLTRVRIYIDHHLKDPSLCPGVIARAHNIWVRQLYKIWPADEPTISQVMMKRRHGAGRDLADPSARQFTVGQIARRWASPITRTSAVGSVKRLG